MLQILRHSLSLSADEPIEEEPEIEEIDEPTAEKVDKEEATEEAENDDEAPTVEETHTEL